MRGDSAGTGVASTQLADQLEVLWELKADDKNAAFEATAVISQGVVYVGDSEGVMRAIKLSDGSPVWEQTFAENGFTSAAAVRGERLFTVDFDGVVRCHRTRSGEVVWQFNAESESSNGPNLFKDALLVTTEAGLLISLNAKTGKERWRFQIDGPLRCSASVGKGHALLAGCDSRLTVVDLNTGKEVGAVDIGGQTGSTAAVVGNQVFFGAETGEFLAVSTHNLTAPTIGWRYHDPRRGQGIRTAAAATKTAVVYANQGKVIYAINPTNGEPLWTQPTKSRIESSPVIVTSPQGGNRVVAATTRGRLLLLDLADGETIWDFDAGGSFVASPAVVDGRIVIGNTEGVLYCFGKKGLPTNERE